VILQDWQSVRIINLASHQLENTFKSANDSLPVPYSIQSASNTSLLLISYGVRGPVRATNFDNRTHPNVQNELVDISTGQHRSVWESADIPQSLSPNGMLAAVSDWESSNILVEVKIVDTGTGQEVKTLHSGYKFGKPWNVDPHGRVIGKFLTDDEILLSPDEHIDRTGHQSGSGLKVFRISDEKLVREKRPSSFGSMGDVITSASRDCFAILNWHVSPGRLKRDLDPPEGSLPLLLIYPDIKNSRTLAISQLSLESLKVREYLDRAYSPRLSNRATFVAIAQNGGITVFQRK